MEATVKIRVFKYVLCLLVGICLGFMYKEYSISKYLVPSNTSFLLASTLSRSVYHRNNDTTTKDGGIVLINKQLADATNNPVPKIPGYALVNEELCKDPRIRYVVYAYSAPAHFDGRQAVRKTYGNKALFKDHRLERVFFVGLTNNKAVQEKIEEEATRYGDIVQMNYIDSYDNLVYKSIFTFKFFHDHCRKDVIAIKTDDDLFYDIFIIMDLFKAPQHNEKYIACPVWQEGTMPILRNPKSCAKWCVREDEFRGLKGYPRYCSGWGWIYSLNFVDDMLAAIKRTHFFKVEDAFTTGVLMGQVKDLKYIDILPNTPIYAKPRVHGTVHLRWQYTKPDKPRNLVFTDVPNQKLLYEMWDLAVKSLYSKSPKTLDELNLEVLSNSTQEVS